MKATTRLKIRKYGWPRFAVKRVVSRRALRWPCAHCGQTGPFACCGGCYCTCLCRADEYPVRTYTLADLWAAFEMGAKEARANGGNPNDELISKSADAYCKLIYHHGSSTGADAAG